MGLRVLRVESVTWSPLVGRVIGHLQVSRDQVQRSPGAAAVRVCEHPGEVMRRGSSRRRGSEARFSSS